MGWAAGQLGGSPVDRSHVSPGVGLVHCRGAGGRLGWVAGGLHSAWGSRPAGATGAPGVLARGTLLPPVPCPNQPPLLPSPLPPFASVR